MNFLEIYISILKNEKNYNIIFYNIKNNIIVTLNINYNLYLKLHYNLYLKLLKCYFLENGFKVLLIKNWYKLGIKYNLILNLVN